MAKIILNKDERQRIEEMSGEEYKDFLLSKIDEYTNSSYYKRFLCTEELDSFVIYPPFDTEGNKYEETEEQRAGRLQIGKQFRNEKFIEQSALMFDVDEYFHIEELINILDITRKTLKTIIASSKDLKAYMFGRRLFINKESVKTFLNNRHYIGTDLDMSDITEFFKKYNKFDSFSKKEKEEAIKEIKSFVETGVFKEKWEQYFKTVPRELRVYQEIKKDYLDIKLGQEEYMKYIPKIYTIYNPNLMLVNEEHKDIPKLYSLKHVANIFGIRERTMLHYCKAGLVYHYKINGKHMLSQDDINRSLLRVQKRNANPKAKKNVGRKTSLETLFDNIDIIAIDKDKVFSKIAPKEYEEYADNLENLRSVEKLITNKKYNTKENITKYNKLSRTDKSLKRKLIKNIIAKEKDIFNFSTELLSEFNEYQKTYKNNIKQIKLFKDSEKNVLAKSIEKSNEAIAEYIEELKEKILTEAISHLNEKYE